MRPRYKVDIYINEEFVPGVGGEEVGLMKGEVKNGTAKFILED